jgi:ribosomal protein RSM22 (predicted rRNA methylase)
MSNGRRNSKPGNLFPDITGDLTTGLGNIPDLLRKIHPMKEKHRKALASGVRLLSTYLTMDRDSLPSDYMTRPEFLSAYLHYFMPWNIYRQGILLQGLDISIKSDATIVDFGSGPLTFLQALWMTRPHMRTNSYQYLAIDRSEPALKIGRKLFEGLAGSQGDGWHVRTERQLGAAKKAGPADLIVAANFINELGAPRAAAGGEMSAEDLLLQRWEGLLKPDAAILIIEPGTRLSGRKLALVRQSALSRGWKVAAPCTHENECAMPGTRGGPWCHFNFTPRDIPEWLFLFSRKVKLPKERASLSFLLLTRGDKCPVKIQPLPKRPEKEGLVRVMSEAFNLPDFQQGRYGCSGKGLVLLQNRKVAHPGPQPGELLTVSWPDKPQRDAKSKAMLIPASDGLDPKEKK